MDNNSQSRRFPSAFPRGPAASSQFWQTTPRTLQQPQPWLNSSWNGSATPRASWIQLSKANSDPSSALVPPSLAPSNSSSPDSASLAFCNAKFELEGDQEADIPQNLDLSFILEDAKPKVSPVSNVPRPPVPVERFYNLEYLCHAIPALNPQISKECVSEYIYSHLPRHELPYQFSITRHRVADMWTLGVDMAGYCRIKIGLLRFIIGKKGTFASVGCVRDVPPVDAGEWTVVRKEFAMKRSDFTALCRRIEERNQSLSMS